MLVRAGTMAELVDDFLVHGLVAVGWGAMGSLASKTAVQMEAELAAAYPRSITRDGRPNKHHREIIDFVTGLRPGDLALTSDRSRRVLFVGEVVGTYEFLPSSGLSSGGEPYLHALPVAWQFGVGRDDVPPHVLLDTDQRGKTAFWLRPATVAGILAAPRTNMDMFL